jgi:outer membrane protein assembly factor BamB
MSRLIPLGRPCHSLARCACAALCVTGLAFTLAACGGSVAPSTSTEPSISSTSTPTSVASSTTSASTPTSASSSTTLQGGTGDWPTYHHDAGRSGVSSDQLPLGTVKQAWRSVALDGAIYAEPLVVDGHVLVATEANSVYALDAATGTVVWQVNLGQAVPGSELPCGNIDPSGITGTPVVDVSSGTIYIAAFLRTGPHHELFALDLATGTTRWHRAIDPPGLSPLVEQERGALTLAGGRVYVPYGGLYGDCGQYQGAVVSAASDGTGALTSYVVPTSRMAGIWNPAGLVVDSTGDLWVTTGNSASQSSFDFGNAVIRLSPQLAVLDYFAPDDWVSLNARDADLGSLGPVLLPNNRVLAVGKTGAAYLLDGAKLGHVGGALASAQIGSSAFGAAAVTGSMVFVPCSGALVGIQAAGDRIVVAWSLSGGHCPPIVAAGQVWSLAYDGRLTAVDPETGAVRFSTQLSAPASRFFSPAAADGRLFVADGTNIAAFGLR